MKPTSQETVVTLRQWRVGLHAVAVSGMNFGCIVRRRLRTHPMSSDTFTAPSAKTFVRH